LSDQKCSEKIPVPIKIRVRGKILLTARMRMVACKVTVSVNCKLLA